MSNELSTTPLSPDELAKRQKDVRKVVLIRGLLLGMIVAGWWIFFAPDELVVPSLRNILGVAAGLIATGAYYFVLRAELFPGKKQG
jgi:hypothetical protein